MELRELTEKFQILCHEGHSKSEVIADVKDLSTAIIESIEVDIESERIILKVAI